MKPRPTNRSSRPIVHWKFSGVAGCGFSVGCLAVGLTLFTVGCRPDVTATNSTVTTNNQPRRVVALGQLDPAGGILEISAIPGERLLSYADGVEEGKKVEPGSVLATLSSSLVRSKQLTALQEKYNLSINQQKYEVLAAGLKVKQAEAAVKEAEAKRADLNSQEKKLQSLSEAAAIAQEDVALLERLQGRDPELVTKHELRRKRNATDRAQNDFTSLRDSLPGAKAAAEAALDAAKTSLKIAEANLAQLKQNDRTKVVRLEKEVAEESLEQSRLRAPGEPGDPKLTVLKKFMEPGELVTQLPVLQIADLSEMVCTAEVYEGDLTDIAVGQPVTITSRTFDKKFKDGISGVVSSIGSMVGNPSLTNRNPLAPSDRSVVEVRIKFAPPEGSEEEKAKQLKLATEEAAARVGVQVSIEFEPLKKETEVSDDAKALNRS